MLATNDAALFDDVERISLVSLRDDLRASHNVDALQRVRHRLPLRFVEGHKYRDVPEETAALLGRMLVRFDQYALIDQAVEHPQLAVAIDALH